MRWTRHSSYLIGSFVALLLLIAYIWWPLIVDYAATFNPKISFWRQFDWLLVGIFLVMSLLVMAGADIKTDAPIVLIGLAGGFLIETWGTRTELWSYYTNERPPLWIIPAWPIASLATDRLYRILKHWARRLPDGLFAGLHWPVALAFLALMVTFVWPTLNHWPTAVAVAFSALFLLTPGNSREAVLMFVAGTGLGYFLEVWGTTRLCWTYYTQQTPPLFAVLAHGMAAVAFWRIWTLYPLLRQRAVRILTE